jgi:hypothetical protein
VGEVARHVQAKEEKAASKPFHLSNVVLEKLFTVAKRDGFTQLMGSR